jgi:hypothetical protein
VMVSVNAAESARHFQHTPVTPFDHLQDAWFSLQYNVSSGLGIIIWIAVYSVLLLPFILIGWLVIRNRRNRASSV